MVVGGDLLVRRRRPGEQHGGDHAGAVLARGAVEEQRRAVGGQRRRCERWTRPPRAEHVEVAVAEEVDGAGGGHQVVLGPHALEDREVVPVDRVLLDAGTGRCARSRRRCGGRRPCGARGREPSRGRRRRAGARRRLGRARPGGSMRPSTVGQPAEVAHVEDEVEHDRAVERGGVRRERLVGGGHRGTVPTAVRDPRRRMSRSWSSIRRRVADPRRLRVEPRLTLLDVGGQALVGVTDAEAEELVGERGVERRELRPVPVVEGVLGEAQGVR